MEQGPRASPKDEFHFSTYLVRGDLVGGKFSYKKFIQMLFLILDDDKDGRITEACDLVRRSAGRGGPLKVLRVTFSSFCFLLTAPIRRHSRAAHTPLAARVRPTSHSCVPAANLAGFGRSRSKSCQRFPDVDHLWRSAAKPPLFRPHAARL